MSRPTLRDVAKAAGMSVTQVSRALNDHDDVAQSTKEKVRQVAVSLNYVPNTAAQRLRDPHARVGALGLILSSDTLRFSDPFFGDLLTALVSEAGAVGMGLHLSTHPADTPVVEPYEVAIRQRAVDGFVLVRTEISDDRIDYLLNADVPFVSFGRPLDRFGFPSVESTQDCLAAAIDHLVDLGHERIMCLAEPSHFALGAARVASFHMSVRRRSLKLPPASVVEAGFHEESGYEATVELLRRVDRPTAIVAMNDLLAFGAIRAAKSLGLVVPDDLSVIGFDDIPSAAMVHPALTTIRQSPEAMGEALIALVMSAIDSGSLTDSQQTLLPTLVLRETTAPPPTVVRSPNLPGFPS